MAKFKVGITVDNFNCFGKDRFKKMKEFGFDYGNYCIMDLPAGMTEEEWEAIRIEDDIHLTSATIHYNYVPEE